MKIYLAGDVSKGYTDWIILPVKKTGIACKFPIRQYS